VWQELRPTIRIFTHDMEEVVFLVDLVSW